MSAACYACGQNIEPWPCEECKGPEITLACEKCHAEVRHGVTPYVSPVHFCGGPPAIWKDDHSGASSSWDSAVRRMEDA